MMNMGKRLGLDNCFAVGRSGMGVVWQCFGMKTWTWRLPPIVTITLMLLSEG